MVRWTGKVFLVGALVALVFGAAWLWQNQDGGIISPLASSLKKNPASLNPYSALTFEALAKRDYQAILKLTAHTKNEKAYDTYVFTYQSDGKTVSGMANIPKGKPPFPVIVLLRGWADREVYYTGYGTEKSANAFAEHGFLTLAPDFLGYGYSDGEGQDILVARFTRPVTVLDLLSAIPSLPQADPNRIGLWGHSNGGQIALSILEITGKSLPTTLWAPVSLGFPDSVLVYLGEQDDNGNLLKAKLDEFLKDNDPKAYSISECFRQIHAPFIIHQGQKDEMIKVFWTQNLVSKLKENQNEATLYLYPGENHNFNRYPESGETLRQRDIKFFQRWLSGTD